MKSTLLFTLFFSFSLLCSAQINTISGTVYDEYKNVIPNANVIVKNTKKGVVTNHKGQFSIDVETTAVLEVSYLGYETQEVFAGKHRNATIILETQMEALDAAIIVGYQSKTRCNYSICRGCGSVIGYEIKEEKSSAFERIPSKQRITSLFPNPSANGLFQLQLDKTYTNITIEVFNMNGQLLQTSAHSELAKIPQIDLSKHPKGIYLIRTKADGKLLETKKAIRS